MEERSLKIYGADKTFFSKLTTTITKLLIPTKVGINGMLISVKRSNMLKAYQVYIESDSLKDEKKKEALIKKYEDTFTLYLESIDKYIMDSIYKKVKNDTASDFEKKALSQYYMVTQLKETDFLEYKYRKQKYLLDLDYESVLNTEKEKLIEKYNKVYISKMDMIFKGILKHYSIQLADKTSTIRESKEVIYKKIFSTLEEYISTILPLKLQVENKETYKEIIDEYDKYERFIVGKLDRRDEIEKNIILLGISRNLFTHSLPLIVAEQCYIKLLKDTRSLIVDTKVAKKREKAYELLINLIEEYNIKLLSTKIYWDRPAEREIYKAFWKEYNQINELKKSDYIEHMKQKEILFVKNDLRQVYKNENRYYKIIQFYKKRLCDLGVMRKVSNTCTTLEGKYVKVEN
ncbi:MAG: hypothetical protein IKT41_03350 [Clostridia bacterium]|nr:hypothetical protein [Clostridia bacterium]